MKTVKRGETFVLSLTQDDLLKPPEVQAAFDEIMSVLSQKSLVVDMAQVTSLTSMGVSAITAGAEIARRTKARLALAGIRPEVRRLLDVLGLDDAHGASTADGCVMLMDDAESAVSRLNDQASNS